MENGLEAELDDELGYSKYDYKNKDTDNSRNGHSSKRLRTSFGQAASLLSRVSAPPAAFLATGQRRSKCLCAAPSK